MGSLTVKALIVTRVVCKWGNLQLRSLEASETGNGGRTLGSQGCFRAFAGLGGG